ncbi:MAG TPA: NADP-dependent oxidoreductase [Terriglobales bacterium]|nr:NADP-dependent oxidoreductase [Terriglobales bacterium]
MKAVRIHSYGKSEQLRLEEAPQPKPEAGQVVVHVFCAGVNPVDWKIREGYLRGVHTEHFPLTLGQDFSGQVIGMGPGAHGVDIGARVFGFASGGAYAEYALANPEHIAPLPGPVSYETGAALPTPGVTAYQALHDHAQIQSGQSLLVHGGAGAVGSLALQLARLMQVHCTATISHEADAAFLRELGVSHVILNGKDRFEERLQNLDAVLDLIGGDLQTRSLERIRRGGVLVSTVGFAPGTEDAAQRRGVRAVAMVMQRRRKDLEELARLTAQGELQVRVARVLPFEQARQAQDLSQAGEARGKVMLRVA